MVSCWTSLSPHYTHVPSLHACALGHTSRSAEDRPDGVSALPQVSITDYVVFDQCSLFQTIMHATHSVATAAQVPVEKVADRLRTAFWSQQLQCQPSLLGVNSSGVWISSGKNELHVAKGSLIGGSLLPLHAAQ